MSEFATAWIVGAGFSRSLGGPLIQNLLAWQDRKIIDHLFRDPDLGDAMFKARAFFKWGKGQYWDDAEQFLDIVETAASEDPSTPPSRLSNGHGLLSSVLRDVVRVDPALSETVGFNSLDELAVSARAAVAADCSLFVRTAQAKGERWMPYVNWARDLNRHDTILTFNYDEVPDILSSPEARTRMIVVEPSLDKDAVDARLAEIRAQDGVPVLKLHGSVSWYLRDGNCCYGRDAAVSLLPRKETLMGLPGPAKESLREKWLGPLWTRGLEAIRSADRVVFLGYRFPPTDARARTEILQAISDSRSTVTTVLGPSPGAVGDRVATLLGHALRRRRNNQREPLAMPLYVEDFLSFPDLYR